MLRKTIYSLLTLLAFTALFFAAPALAHDEWMDINTAEDMFLIAQYPNANFSLNADINMDGIQWTPVPFNGTFEGNNFTIYNLDLNKLSQEHYITIDGNHKEYDTYFASLFSGCYNAVIQNLSLINVQSDITTNMHCFIAGIVGYSVDTEIINCHITGRMKLNCSNVMCGIGGLVGFGTGFVRDSSAELTAVYMDENQKGNSEEFMGGIWACGYPSVSGCDVKMDAYATTISYTHNGSIIGMHHVHHRYVEHYGSLTGCTADFKLHLYKHNLHHHQHNEPFVGEALHWDIAIHDNTLVNYEKILYDDTSILLMPCTCESALYNEIVTPPTCTDWGYSEFTCEECGYSYKDDYTPPAHTEGEWEVELQPTYDSEGIKVLRCSVCGEILQTENIPVLVEVVEDEPEISYFDMAIPYKTSYQHHIDFFEDGKYYTDAEWTSSDEEVIKVDNEGNITAVGRGTAVVKCKSKDINSVAYITFDVKYTFWQWVIVVVLFGWVWY